MTTPLTCGLSLIGLSPRHYATVATAAEEAGFDSIWLPDHLVYPTTIPPEYPYSDDGASGFGPHTALLDPWIGLAYVAAATRHVRLATHVYILPLRPVFVTARTLVTLDRVSGGRVTLGAGVGWLKGEYDAAGESFETRGRRADELIVLLRRLWTEAEIEHHSDLYDFGPVAFEPKPVQKPCIPIHVGGSSAPALRRAGRLGDGYIDIGARTVEDVADRLRTIAEHRRSAGREDRPFEVTVGQQLFGARAKHRALSEVGVGRVLTHLWGQAEDMGSVDKALAFIEWFAAERTSLGFSAPHLDGA